MKSLKYDFEAIRKLLLQAYLARDEIKVGNRWQAEVMRRVRNIGPLQSAPDRLMLFGQLVWRLAPVTCLLVLVAGAVLLKSDLTPEFNVLVDIFVDTEEITLAQLFPL